MLWKNNVITKNNFKRDVESKKEELIKIFSDNQCEQVVRNKTLHGKVKEILEDNKIRNELPFKAACEITQFLRYTGIKQPVFEIGDKIVSRKMHTFKEGDTYHFVDVDNDIRFTIEERVNIHMSYICEDCDFSDVESRFLVEKAKKVIFEESMKPKKKFRNKLISLYCNED